MLTKDDLKAIGALLDEKLKEYPTKSELDAQFKQQKVDILNEVDGKLDQKLKEQTANLLKGIADYIADSLIPYFDKHEKRLEHLEKHTKHPPGTPATN